MSVTLTITGPDGVGVAEPELAGRLDELREAVGGDEPPDGLLVIRVPGGPVVEIADDLWAAVQNLCFACVPMLLEEGTAFVYRYTASDTSATLSLAARQIVISGDDVPRLSAPADLLLVALYECGTRYLDLLDRLGRHTALRQHLGRYAERARDCLQRSGLLGS